MGHFLKGEIVGLNPRDFRKGSSVTKGEMEGSVKAYVCTTDTWLYAACVAI